MTFADTSHINLKEILFSVRKAEEFIRKFVNEHLKDQSSFTGEIRGRLRKSDIKIQLTGLGMLYQQLIIPQAEHELKKSARLEVESEWRRKGKEPYYQKEVGTTGKYIQESAMGFEPEVKKRFDEKKTNNKYYWQRTAEQTRIGSASNIINGGGVESTEPSGMEMGDGSDDGNYTPPPSQEKKCESCSKKIHGKGKHCKECFRKWFVENRLKNLRGWKELDTKSQEHYLSQVNNCEKAADFKRLKQMVLDTIGEITTTCSECNKTFYGTRWYIKEIEDKYFCSQDCAKKWQKKNRTGSETGEINSNGNEGEGNGNDFDFDDNSDDGSHDIPNQNENENGELPQNIQAITRLPLPQAQERAEQEIEKSLKDNSLSEQELDIGKLVGESHWKDYLRKLDTPAKVAQFTHQMQQAILRKALTKKTSSSENKKPQNDWILPVIILVIFISTLTLIIIRKRKKRGF